MTVHVDEMTTSVETYPDAPGPHADSGGSETPAEQERASRAAERTMQIARRTHAEGFDD
jgi:hypothetical protein